MVCTAAGEQGRVETRNLNREASVLSGRKDHAMTMTNTNATFGEMRQWLTDHGYVVGLRLSNRNQDFEGDYSVCAQEIVGNTTADASDGYCIVGNDLEELVCEAYSHLNDDAA
jgi:hypothetical protein